MKTVAISGGFDPIHSGHIALINDASRYGQVVAILNSNEWLVRKKGKFFMDWRERALILLNIKNVHSVSLSIDEDDTVCETLRVLKPDYFANGGDRVSNNTPELEVCEELGITPIFGVGGLKTQSSSELLDKYASKSS